MYETRAHLIALSIAILGPLLHLMLGPQYAYGPPLMYAYWAAVLSVYILILIPFTYKVPFTLIKLIFLGIAVEDFFSNLWRSLLLGENFLPFSNWYTEHFPFLGSLGEPTPYILIPKWYLLAFLIYFVIVAFQYKNKLKSLTN
jgi:hypothetical protein